MDLADRLQAIDRLPLSPAGRELARLACWMNEWGVEVDPEWARRIGSALAQECHAARVPTGRLRRLVDPGAAVFVGSVEQFMRPLD